MPLENREARPAIYVNPLDVSLLMDRGDGTTTLLLRSGQREDRVYVINAAIERVAARINGAGGVA